MLNAKNTMNRLLRLIIYNIKCIYFNTSYNYVLKYRIVGSFVY